MAIRQNSTLDRHDDPFASGSGSSLQGEQRSPEQNDWQRDMQRQGGARRGAEHRLVKGFGWFSIGLGLWGFASPRGVARAIGVTDDSVNVNILRAVGAREIVQGIGILSQARPTGWLWSRVVGDALDLSYLSWALTSGEVRDKNRTMAALASVLGVMGPDLYCSLTMSRHSSAANGRLQEEHGMQVKRAVTVNRPIDEVSAFWHDIENLPRVMSHLESVTVTGPGRSHWKAQAPGGGFVEWDAITTGEEENARIAWESVAGADVPNSGVVRFRPAPGGRGTEVVLELRFDAPGGNLGRIIARLFGKDPGQQIANDLYQFKQYMETGEVLVSDATVAAAGLIQRPAQPPEEPPQTAAA